MEVCDIFDFFTFSCNMFVFYIIIRKATENLVQMRKTEGSKLAEDLNQRLDNLKVKIEDVSKLSTGLIEEYVGK